MTVLYPLSWSPRSAPERHDGGVAHGAKDQCVAENAMASLLGIDVTETCSVAMCSTGSQVSLR